MSYDADQILDLPFDARPDPDEFVRAAMEWHFSPDTGAPYWLERAKTLDFDPRLDVKGHADLTLFPNVANELRHVPARDLIPRGYGSHPEVVAVYESGGTTGAPKRVVCLRDWMDRLVAWSNANLDRHGFPRGVNWLGLIPTGPHIVGELFRRSAATHGDLGFTIDLDPRWVKKLIASGRGDVADAYAEHLIDQAAFVLRTQDVGVLTITPPLLERLACRDELVDLVNAKVRAIRWGGTQLDADTRHLYRTEIFPDITLYGHYGSTMILGIAGSGPGCPTPTPACSTRSRRTSRSPSWTPTPAGQSPAASAGRWSCTTSARACCCPTTWSGTWPPGSRRPPATWATQPPTSRRSSGSRAKTSSRGCTECARFRAGRAVLGSPWPCLPPASS